MQHPSALAKWTAAAVPKFDVPWCMDYILDMPKAYTWCTIRECADLAWHTQAAQGATTGTQFQQLLGFQACTWGLAGFVWDFGSLTGYFNYRSYVMRVFKDHLHTQILEWGTRLLSGMPARHGALAHAPPRGGPIRISMIFLKLWHLGNEGVLWTSAFSFSFFDSFFGGCWAPLRHACNTQGTPDNGLTVIRWTINNLHNR